MYSMHAHTMAMHWPVSSSKRAGGTRREAEEDEEREQRLVRMRDYAR